MSCSHSHPFRKALRLNLEPQPPFQPPHALRPLPQPPALAQPSAHLSPPPQPLARPSPSAAAARDFALRRSLARPPAPPSAAAALRPPPSAQPPALRSLPQAAPHAPPALAAAALQPALCRSHTAAFALCRSLPHARPPPAGSRTPFALRAAALQPALRPQHPPVALCRSLPHARLQPLRCAPATTPSPTRRSLPHARTSPSAAASRTPAPPSAKVVLKPTIHDLLLHTEHSPKKVVLKTTTPDPSPQTTAHSPLLHNREPPAAQVALRPRDGDGRRAAGVPNGQKGKVGVEPKASAAIKCPASHFPIKRRGSASIFDQKDRTWNHS
nr:vegetative cell wall protein gp1-like [Penaeus vannamei]